MNKKWVVAVFTAVSLLLAGCANSSNTGQSSTGSKELQEINLTTPQPTTSSSVYVADKLGYFKEFGLKVNFVGQLQNSEYVAAILSGKVDAAAGHINVPLEAVAQGAKIKCVVAESVSTETQPHMVFVVRKDSNINSAADVVGKKFALSAYNACTEYFPYEYLRVNGISNPKGKFTWVVIPEANMVQALVQGQVDVIGLHKSIDYVQQQGLKLLFTDYQVSKNVGGATPFYFSDKFIKEKPDVVRSFVKAIVKGNQYINAHQSDAVKLMASGFNVSETSVSKYHFVDNGIIEKQNVQYWIDTLKRYGDLPKSVNASDVYTNEFNPNQKK